MLGRIYKAMLVILVGILSLQAVKNYAKAEGGQDELKRFIESYFHAQYQCLSNLKEKDLKEFYYIECPDGEKAYMIDKESISYIIACRNMQQNDLKLRSYYFDLDYKLIDIKGDIAKVILLENSEFEFNFLKDTTSRKYNVEHNFELKRSDSGWKITSHDCNEDEFRIIRDGIKEFRSYEGVKEFYLDMMRKNKEKIKESIRDKKSDENELKKEKEKAIQSNSNKNTKNLNFYDREKAVTYAKQWSENGAKLRNSPPWADYDPPKGNGDCTNFVSQCIHKGEIPMDYKGKEYEQWKWYGDTYNPSQEAKGRVASWTGVKAFYNYCKLNNGFGLSADADSEWNDVHIGDIIQFGKDEDNYFHSVIITEYVYDNNEVLKDFLICCHTTDRHNYPLSAYSYPLKRYIHIKGWSN